MSKLLYITIISVLIFNTLNAKELEKVSVQFHWKYQFEFAGFIAAKEKGFYKDVGLDVELKEYDFGMDVEAEILNRNSTYGIYNSNILKSYLQNKPLKLISSFFKRSALVIITKPDIKTAKDLVGKRVMSSTKEDFNFNLKYIFDAEQVDINSLKLIPHTYNVQDFIDGKCDAMTAFISDQPYKLDKLGVEYNIINPTDYGMHNLQLELFTTNDEISKYPNRTESFRRASIRGWNYALENPSEIIDIIRKKYNPKLSKDFLNNEAKITNRLILPSVYPIGSFDKSFLKRQFEIFRYDYAIKNKLGMDGFLFDIKKEQSTIYLNSKEKEWITNNTFTYAGDPNWLPFEAFDKKGKYIGIVSEHIDIIEKKLDIKFNKVITKNWMDTLELSKKVGVDIISGDASNLLLSKNYKPIDTYLKNPLVMVAREDYPFISDLNNIKDKKIAFLHGAGYGVNLQKKYPNIKFIELNSPQDALIKLKSGEIDIFIGSLALIDYTMIQMGIENLKIVGDTGLTMNLTLYVNKNKPLLHSILNKTVNSISDIKKHEVISKWRHYKSDKVIVDYTLVWQILIVFLIITLIGISFVIILRTKIKKAVAENRKKDLLIIEQTQLASKSKSEFLANMSHEIRTPMNAIIGFTELLSEQMTEPRLKSYVNTIQSASNTLLTLINDILDLSKIEAGKLQITKTATDIHHLGSDMGSIFMMNMQKKDLDFIIDISDDIPSSLLVDEVRLRQILLNIIGNSVKFTENGFVKLVIKTKKIYEHNSKVDLEISVEDSGIGIPETQLKKIFQEFEQSEGQDNRKFGGTGLGLSISKRLCEMLDGGISVSSKEGEGTTFTMNFYHIDIASVEQENKSEIQPIKDSKKIVFKDATILVADDVENNRNLILKNFEDTKIKIITAVDGIDAVEQYKKEKPDLILMDVRMPKMDGYEATKIIRTISDIPIIALTASVMEDENKQVKRDNFNGFLRKPVLRDALFLELSNFLEHEIVMLSEKKEEVIILSDKAKLNITTILNVLEDDIKPMHTAVLKSNNITEIQNMASEINELALKYDVEILTQYSSKLYEATDAFDIMKLEELLKEFDSIVKKLVF